MLVSAAAAEIAGALTPSDVCGLFGVCPNAVAALGLPAMQVGRTVRFSTETKATCAARSGRLLRPCKPCLQPGLPGAAGLDPSWCWWLPSPNSLQGPFDCPFCKLAVETFIARIEVGSPWFLTLR